MGEVGETYSYTTHPSILENLNIFPATSNILQEYIRQQDRSEPVKVKQCLEPVVLVKIEDEEIGQILLVGHEYRQGELCLAMKPSIQCKRYASEALPAFLDYGFSTIGFHRIIARVRRSDIHCWMLLSEVGMRREGWYWQDHEENGEWQDTYLYAMLTSEWQK